MIRKYLLAGLFTLLPLVVRLLDATELKADQKRGEPGGSFVLIAGERRLRAATLAGLPEVPVHVVGFDDQQVYEAALVENIQRADLNPIEKASGFKDYLERFSITQEQLAERLAPLHPQGRLLQLGLEDRIEDNTARREKF